MKTTERTLLRFKKALLSALRKEGADFGLHLVSNAQMNEVRQELLARKDFKGAEARKIAREKMVNVLSFPETPGFPHPEVPKNWLGEVYLNAAFGRQHPDRLPALMVHGVLHLLGYRHDRLRDTMKMEMLEKKLCTQLKISRNLL
jgi:ssRNA-specific RNase YbeY (16S rRNA maturation enzyme)